MRFGFGVPCVLDACGAGKTGSDGVVAVACHPSVHVAAFLSRSSLQLWSSGANVVFLGSIPIPGTGLGKDDDGATHIVWQQQGKAISVATRHRRILFFDADVVLANSDVFTANPPTACTCSLSNVAPRIKFRTEVRINYGIITGLTNGGRSSVLAITSGGFVCCVGWHRTQLIHAWNTVFLSSAQHSIEFDPRAPSAPDFTSETGNAWGGQGMDKNAGHTGKVPATIAPTLSNTQLQVHATKESVYSGTIVSVAFHSALQLLALTLSDGFVALLEGLSDERVVYGDTVSFKGSCVRVPSVAKVAINGQHRLLAAATLGGGVSCKRIDPKNFSLTQFWSNSRWCEEQRNFGPVSDLMWSPDEDTLLVSYHHHGIVLLHFSGVCLLSTFSRYDVGTPGSFTMRSSEPSFSDYDKKNASSPVLSRGCTSVCWDPNGYRVYAVEAASRSAYVLPLTQVVSSSEVCSVAQYSPIAMFDGSRLYLSHCSSREGTEGEWEIAPCPPLYLQKGYPLAYCEVSSDGEHIVCAGALGFAFFHRRVRRWRVPPLDRVCASVVCVAAPAWIRNEAVVLPARCCTNQNNFELKVYSRFLPSNRELLAKTPLGRKPIMVRTSTGESSRGWIVVLTTANDMIFYQFNLKSDHLFAPHEVSVTLSYITRVDLHERIQRPLEVLCVPPHDHSATIATPYPTGRGRAASTHNTNSTATGSNPRLPQKHLDAGQGAGAGMRASFFSLPSLYILQRNHHLVAISYCNDSGASEGVGGGNTRNAQTRKDASNEISAVSNGEAAEAKSTTTGEKGKSQSSFGWGGFSSWGAVPTSAAGEKQSHSTPPGHFALISVCNEPVYRVWRDASAPVEGASLLVFGNSGLSCVVVREQNSSTNDNKNNNNNNNSTLYCKYKFNLSPLDGDMVPLGVSVYDGYIVMGTEGRVRHGFATVWQDRVFPHFTVSTKRALFQHTLAIAAIADGFNIPTTPVNPTSSRRANGDSLFEKSGRAVKEGARGVSSSAAGDHAEGPRGGISQASKPERDESSAYGNIHDVARAPSIGPLYALGSGFVAWLESMRENGTFTPIMDYMLHYITSEKDSMNIRFVDDRSVVLQLISFLRLYPEFYEIVIGFVRKIDALQWQMVLDVVGSPVDFFFECVAANRLKEAAQLVRIIMMGEGPLLESVLNRLKQQGGLPSLAQVSESANDGKANASNSASLASDLTLTRSPQMQLLEATALCAQHLFIVVMRNRDFQGAFEVLRFTAMLQNELSVDSSKPQPPPATQTSVPHRSQENLKRSTSTRDRADSPAKLERSFTNGDAVAAASYSSATGTSAAAAEPAQSSMFTRALRSVGILASPEEAAAFFPVETGEIFAQLSSPDLAGVGSEKVSNQSEVQVGASSTSTHPKGEALQGNLSMTHHKVDDTLESQIGTVAGTPFKFFGRDVAMSTQARRGSCSIFQFLCLPQHKPLLAEIENASTDLLFAGCLSQLEDLLDIFSIDALYFLKAMSMSLPQLPMAPVLPQEPENAPDASKPSVDPSETTAAGNPKPNAESSAAPQPEDETRIADCNVVDRPLNAILLFDALHDEYGLPRCPGKPQEPHVHPELPPPFFQAQSLERTAAQLGTSEKGLAAGGAEGGDVASLEDAQQQQREEEQRRAERRQAVTAILRKMTTTTQEYLSHNPAVFEKLVRMRRLMTEAEIPEYQMALSMLCLDASDVATLANTYPSLRDALGELATHPCYAGYQPFVTLCLSL